jgi:nucleoside triphosphate pyrophosphatase
MPLWLADWPLVLASKSEIRRALLADAGIPVEVSPADVDERGIEERAATRDAGEIALVLARAKAHAIAARLPGRLVLGADQTLALGERRFSKPSDRAAARDQLKALRGQTHELHTAVALARDGAIVFEHRELARLTMRAFSDGFLGSYLDAMGGAVMASVGGYQLEKAGVQLFERIDGDHFVILGLPLVALLAYLRRAGCLAE